jgi:dTDP-4-dehydrorhamnose 3,5-epimerase
MKPLTQCPGCGCARLCATWRIARQPVVLNYRFTSATAAARVARRNLCLAQCAGCGLIFNAAWDSAAVPYDDNYENRQCCSPAFQEYLRMVADSLVAKYHLQGGRILEVGCGKGDFLKLLCARGAIYDVAVDLRPVSSTSKRWLAMELTAENGRALYIPEGFAHDFQSLADDTEVFYQMSEFYHPESARGICWNDPAFGIQWPDDQRQISKQDMACLDYLC